MFSGVPVRAGSDCGHWYGRCGHFYGHGRHCKKTAAPYRKRKLPNSYKFKWKRQKLKKSITFTVDIESDYRKHWVRGKHMVLWVLGLSAAFAVALNGTMVMPAIVLAMQGLPGYDEGLATAVASAELAGVAIYGLFLAGVVMRLGRSGVIGAIVLTLIGQLISYFVTDPLLMSGARFVAGLGEGAIFGIVTSQIAAIANAERIWGALNFIGGIAMGILLFIVSILAGDGGGHGPVFLCLAVFVLIMMPVFLFTSRGASKPVEPHDAVPMQRMRLVLCLIMVALVYAVQAGQWAICGIIGARSALGASQIGFYLAVSSILGFIGAAIPALVHAKSLRLPAIFLGLVLMGGSLYAFFFYTGSLVFVGAQTFLNIGFYIVTPFVTGLLTEHDKDGSLLSRVLVVAIVGAAIGTGAAGSILTAWGPTGFAEIFLGLLAVTAICGVAIFGPLHPRKAALSRPLAE